LKRQLHQHYALMIMSISENSFRTKQTLLTHRDRTNELNAINHTILYQILLNSSQRLWFGTVHFAVRSEYFNVVEETRVLASFNLALQVKTLDLQGAEERKEKCQKIFIK